jgi:hypothetical protein
LEKQAAQKNNSHAPTWLAFFWQSTHDVCEDKGDVAWHQPVITHGATSSDLIRGMRQLEEPALTLALWQATPKGLRWALSSDALEYLAQTTGDDDERAWARGLLGSRRRGTAKAKARQGWGMGKRRGGGRGQEEGPTLGLFSNSTWGTPAE